MTRTELATIVREELRAGIMLTADPPPSPPYDLHAERALISSAWSGIVTPSYLQPEHFFAPLHRLLFQFLTTNPPDIPAALNWLAARNVRSPTLSPDIEALVTYTPAQVQLEPIAMHVVELSWRRSALDHIAQAQALLRSPGSDLSLAAQNLTAAISRMRGQEPAS